MRPAAAQSAKTLPHADGADPSRLREVLDAHQWRRADAARTLGISRSTLWRKMREAGFA